MAHRLDKLRRAVLGDKLSASGGFVGVGGDRLVGFEVSIALDRKSELAAHARQFRKTDIPEFGLAKSKIAEAEG